VIHDEPRIALAASPRGWAHALHRHVADHGGARVRATVLHHRDAVAEDYDVFVADDTTSFLTRRLITELHRLGRGVLGVFDPDDPRGKDDLLDLGVDDVIARDAEPAAFVAALTALHRSARRPVDDELDRLVRGLAEPAAIPVAPGTAAGAALHGGSSSGRALGAPPGAPPGAAPDAPVAPRRLVAVGGAGGGTGATEVAIALAAAAGRPGRGAVLVDADEGAPALAQRLGLAPYPNLRAAVDALETGEDPADLLADVSAGGFAVLPGLSAVRGWAELRAQPAVAVLETLARPLAIARGLRHDPSGACCAASSGTGSTPTTRRGPRRGRRRGRGLPAPRTSATARRCATPPRWSRGVLRSITEFGPLTDLFARPDVEEVFIEGAQVTYIDGTGRLQGLAAPTTEEENRAGRRPAPRRPRSATSIPRSPLVQARVLGGTARLTAAIAPIADTAVGDDPPPHAATRHPLLARRARVADPGRRASSGRDAGRRRACSSRVRRGRGRPRCCPPARRRPDQPLHPLLRGDPRAERPPHPRLVLRGTPAGLDGTAR
jgi:hypothetical protein